MIAIGKSWVVETSYPQGRPSDRQLYKLEESDVGRYIKDYGGYHQRGRTIKADEVGKHIAIDTDACGYHSWFFWNHPN